MTDTPTTPQAQPLTAAEKNLRERQRQLDMDGVEVGVSRQALDEVLATLDASRAETEAVRRERDEAHEAFIEESTDLVNVAAEREALRSLAAELVEGLERITSVGEEYCHDDFMADAVDRASALIAKARAAGIAPKGEKGEG